MDTNEVSAEGDKAKPPRLGEELRHPGGARRRAVNAWCRKHPIERLWASDQEGLPLEMFWALSTGQGPRDRPRIRWLDYISCLGMERLGVPQHKLESFVGEKEEHQALPAATETQLWKMDRWMHGWTDDSLYPKCKLFMIFSETTSHRTKFVIVTCLFAKTSQCKHFHIFNSIKKEFLIFHIVLFLFWGSLFANENTILQFSFWVLENIRTTT